MGITLTVSNEVARLLDELPFGEAVAIDEKLFLYQLTRL